LRIARAERVGDEVVVSWVMQEDHPDQATFKLEYRPAGNEGATWTPLPVMPAPEGEQRFRPATADALEVRLTVRDRAGNEGIARASVAAGGSGPPAFGGPGVPGEG